MSRVTIPMIVRMRELWDAGLSYGAIAAVVSLDWRREVTGPQVRAQLRSYERGTHGRGGARLGAHGMSKPPLVGFGAAPDMSGGGL